MPLYASDVLEPLLEAAAARSAVREHCARLIGSLEPELQQRLGPATRYVGGKCMGYPAIWLLQRVLEPHGVPLPTIVELSEPALSVSLTTSIVDDLMDRDEAIDEEYVAILYVLMTHASFAPSAGCATAGAQRAFLGKALEVCSGSGDGEDADERRGDRIGHFFRMIASGQAFASLPDGEAHVLIEATGRFGGFCAHLDDWIDHERDQERGVHGNVALRMLQRMRKTPTSSRRINPGEMEMLSSLMEDALIAQLGEVRSLLGSIEAAQAVAALDETAKRIGGCLAKVTAAQATRVQWMAQVGLRRTVTTR
jgi:hypothetical protein